MSLSLLPNVLSGLFCGGLLIYGFYKGFQTYALVIFTGCVLVNLAVIINAIWF